MSYQIVIEKDGEGYLARIEGRDDLYAYDSTPEKAKKELYHVLEMMIEIHQEDIENEKKMQSELLQAGV